VGRISENQDIRKPKQKVFSDVAAGFNLRFIHTQHTHCGYKKSNLFFSGANQ